MTKTERLVKRVATHIDIFFDEPIAQWTKHALKEFVSNVVKDTVKEVSRELTIRKKMTTKHAKHYLDGEFCVTCQEYLNKKEVSLLDNHGYNKAVDDLLELKAKL